MNFSRNRRLVSAAALIIWICSCAPSPPRRAASSEREEVRAILRELRARQESLKTLKGLASIHFGNRVFGATSEAVVLLSLPSRLAVDGLSPFGFYDYRMRISGGDLTLLWEGRRRYLKGLASRDLLARYLSISLDPEKAISLLATAVPMESEEDYRLVHRRGGIVLKGRSTQLTVASQDGVYLPTGLKEFGVDGSLLYEVQYRDWQAEGDLSFPRELSAHFREPPARIRIRYETAELNQTLPPADFQIEIPQDAEPL